MINKTLLLLLMLVMVLVDGCGLYVRPTTSRSKYCQELGFDKMEWEDSASQIDMDFYCVYSRHKNNFEGEGSNNILFVMDDTYKNWKEER